jgi:hypothetical protein
VLGGAVLVEAISDNNATAHTVGASGAAIGIAELHPIAIVGGGTKANFDGSLPDIATDASTLTVKSRTGNDATANAEIAYMKLLAAEREQRPRRRSRETTKRQSDRMRRSR